MYKEMVELEGKVCWPPKTTKSRDPGGNREYKTQGHDHKVIDK